MLKNSSFKGCSSTNPLIIYNCMVCTWCNLCCLAVCLFGSPIITHEPLDRFSSNFDQITQSNHRKKSRQNWVPKLLMYICIYHVYKMYPKILKYRKRLRLKIEKLENISHGLTHNHSYHPLILLI